VLINYITIQLHNIRVVVGPVTISAQYHNFMSNAVNNSNNRRNDEEQFQLAFGGASSYLYDDINAIRNNDPRKLRCYLSVGLPTELGWELVGQYISNNTYLQVISLERSSGMMILVFRGLTKSCSVKHLLLMNNDFGIEGIRSMVPFLRNSPNLSKLDLSGNENINTECFGVLMSALNGSPSMEELRFNECNVKDISALNTYPLPNLLTLELRKNKIGRDGFITISHLLEKEGSTLTMLGLECTGMGDDEAEIIATSLKHNTKLRTLYLRMNDEITEKGRALFLRLLADMSSIKSTYNSNHTLANCIFAYSGDEETTPIMHLIDIVCRYNRESSSPEAAGRTKVIQNQLNSQSRKVWCQLQGIEYSSIANLLADVDIKPILLPNILALIGNKHGQSESYTTLIPLAPELLSFIDRKALLEDTIAKNTIDAKALDAECDREVAAVYAKFSHQRSLLTAKKSELEKQLAYMKAAVGSQSLIMSEHKRQQNC
jgi:hypothetical protein